MWGLVACVLVQKKKKCDALEAIKTVQSCRKTPRRVAALRRNCLVRCDVVIWLVRGRAGLHWCPNQMRAPLYKAKRPGQTFSGNLQRAAREEAARKWAGGCVWQRNVLRRECRGKMGSRGPCKVQRTNVGRKAAFSHVSSLFLPVCVLLSKRWTGGRNREEGEDRSGGERASAGSWVPLGCKKLLGKKKGVDWADKSQGRAIKTLIAETSSPARKEKFFSSFRMEISGR